jgi:hypothetical protein
MKSMYEYYHAAGFSWRLEETFGVRTVFCLQDADGAGDADCEFRGGGDAFWMEMFAIYHPPRKLEVTGRMHLVDKLIRANLGSIPGNISISYGSLQALPDGPVLRRLAKEAAIELSTRLATSDDVAIAAPLQLKAAKNTRMATTSWSGGEDATPRKARESFAMQLAYQLREAEVKLANHGAARGCALVITDHDTNAAAEVEEAFKAVDPAAYATLGAVFWFNTSRRPFTLCALYDGGTLFQLLA